MSSRKWAARDKAKICSDGLRYAQDYLVAKYNLTDVEFNALVDALKSHAEDCFGHEQSTDNRVNPHTSDNILSIYSYLLQSTPHAVFCKDMDGRFIYGNRTYCETLKISYEQLLGKNDFDLHPAEAANQYIADDSLIKSSGKTLSYQEVNAHIDGTSIWTQIIKSPLRNHDNEVIGVMGMFWDITEQKNAEIDLQNSRNNLELIIEARTAELIEANKRLEAGKQLQNSFMSSVSHELRTPLTSVFGFAKIIDRDAQKILASPHPSRPKIKEKLLTQISKNALIIHVEATRLKRLIDDLLDLNKITSGKMTWMDQVIDINHTAERSMEIMQGQFVFNPSTRLVGELFPGPILVMADPDKIEQILINLLNNAEKFTPSGQVKISTHLHENKWAEVRVSDTGTGISPEDLSHIFEMYYQVNQTSPQKSGTGLGLTICHQIISHYGGKFWAKSTEGEGTTFFIRLPLHAAQDDTTGHENDPKDQTGKPV